MDKICYIDILGRFAVEHWIYIYNRISCEQTMSEPIYQGKKAMEHRPLKISDLFTQKHLLLNIR